MVSFYLMNYTNEQLCYLAGLLDGEGCLHVSDKRVSPSKSRGIRRPTRPYRGAQRTYRARINFSTAVSICNTNFQIIDWLYNNFGSIVHCQKKPGKPHWHLRKTWLLSPSKDIKPLLELVFPYIVGKKEQVKLMIEARNIIDSNTKRMEHSLENYNRLLEIANHIKLLNKKALPPCLPSAQAARSSKSITSDLPTSFLSNVP